jgi:hypothetical protein
MITSQRTGELFCKYVARRRRERRAMALHVCALAQNQTSQRLAERFALAVCGCTCETLLKHSGVQGIGEQNASCYP